MSDDKKVALVGPLDRFKKSALIARIAEEQGLECIDIKLTLNDPCDLQGVTIIPERNQRPGDHHKQKRSKRKRKW